MNLSVLVVLCLGIARGGATLNDADADGGAPHPAFGLSSYHALGLSTKLTTSTLKSTAPSSTPLISPYFRFVDENPNQDEFSGKFYLFVDPTAIAGDSDGTLSTVTSFTILDLSSNILATIPYDGGHSCSASVSFSLSPGSNNISVVAVSFSGDGPPIVLTLLDLVPGPLRFERSFIVSDALLMIAQSLADFTPEKVHAFTSQTIALNAGDMFQLRLLPHQNLSYYISSEDNLVADSPFSSLSVMSGYVATYGLSTSQPAPSAAFAEVSLTTSKKSTPDGVSLKTFAWSYSLSSSYVVSFYLRGSVPGQSVKVTARESVLFTELESHFVATQVEWTKYEVDMFGGWNANGVLLAFEFGTADTGLYQLDDIQVLEAVVLSDIAFTFHTKWLADGQSYMDSTGLTDLGPVFATPSKSATFSVTVYGTRYSHVDGPEVTQAVTLQGPTITISDIPTAPIELPQLLLFEDTDLADGRVGGTVTWSDGSTGREYRHFDYFVVYLTDLPALPTDRSSLTPLELVPWVNGTNSYSVVIPSGTAAPKCIHVTLFETTAAGVESENSTMLVVTDRTNADQTLPMVTTLDFVDIDGTPQIIAGNLSVRIPDGAHSTSSKLAIGIGSSRSTPILTLFEIDVLEYESFVNVVIPPLSLNLVGSYLSYFIVTSVSMFPNRTTHSSFLVTDRSDPDWFLSFFLSNVGLSTEQGSRFYPAGSQTTSPAGDVVSGLTTLVWRLPRLDNSSYETLWGGDGSQLMDLSDIFWYDLAVGPVDQSRQFPCSLLNVQNQSPDVPFRGPTSASFATNVFEDSIDLSITASHETLTLCGLEAVGDEALELQGSLQLSINTFSTDSLTSSIVATPQVRVFSSLKISFSDTTAAATGEFAISNLLFLSSISKSLDIPSRVRLYDDAFLTIRSTYSFRALTDELCVEHALLTHTDLFYLDLDRVWFTSQPSPDSPVRYQLPPTDVAYESVDRPHEAGRFRFRTRTPIVLNCRPCYMHIASVLSPVNKQKSLTKESSEKILSSKAVIIEVDYQLLKSTKNSNNACRGGDVWLYLVLGSLSLLFL